MHKFSIIIPTLQKNTKVLNMLIEELVEDDTVGEIILIDNSLKGLEKNSDKIKVVIPKKNLYVNPSWNLGVKLAKYEYVAILNDDIIIPKNLCKQVMQRLEKNSIKGLIGMKSNFLFSAIENEFDSYPENSEISLEEQEDNLYISYWGVAIFGLKSSFDKIPKNIKVYCGDNYLIHKNTQKHQKCYQINNCTIKHLGSLSSNAENLQQIKTKDVYNYSKIDKRFKNHCWYKKRISLLEKFFSITNDDEHKVVIFFGIKCKFKSKKLKQKKINEYNELLKNKNVIVYFDHSLGGGTETYFYNKLSELSKKSVLLRVQYYLYNKRYKITFYEGYKIFESKAINFAFLNKFVNSIKINKIVLNNIVGYPEVKEILNLINNYKINSPQTEVVMKGHDFYSICPKWDLLNYNDTFCNIESSVQECSKCFNKFQLKCNDIQKEFSINNWRKMWEDFFKNTVDIIEVFSKASYNIFSKAYPDTINKIIINPHKIKPFPKYNIAILGNFQLNKGAKIVVNLTEYLKQNKNYDYHFYLIGPKYCDIESDLITVNGAYNRNNLPNILKNHNIDLILIPSTCPETFSYTTAEAIALSYPVACFDMGGQADQVKLYEKGLILSSFEPEVIEKEMRLFLTQEVNKKEFVWNY